MRTMIGAGALALTYGAAFVTGAVAQEEQDPQALSTTQQVCGDLNEMEAGTAQTFAEGYVQGFLAASGDTFPTPQGNTTPPQTEGGEQVEVVDGIANKTDESGTTVGGAAVLRSSDLIEGCQNMTDATLAEVVRQHVEEDGGAQE